MALPGPFLAGQRLTAGQLNDATQKTLDSVQVGVAGAIATGITFTETNIPKMGSVPVPLVNGGLYRFDVSVVLQQSVAGDEFTMRIRRDTAVTGTLVAEWTLYAPQTTAGYRRTLWDDFISSADETVQYFTSFVRAAGTGNLTVYGQFNSANRTGVALRRAGYSSEFRVAV